MNKRVNFQYNIHPFIYTLAGYATHPLQTSTGSNEEQKAVSDGDHAIFSGKYLD